MFQDTIESEIFAGVPNDDAERVRHHDERVPRAEGEADAALAGRRGGQRVGQPVGLEGNEHQKEPLPGKTTCSVRLIYVYDLSFNKCLAG